MRIKLIFVCLFMLFANNLTRDMSIGRELIIEKRLSREQTVKSDKQGHGEDPLKDIVEDAYWKVTQILATHLMNCNFYLVKMHGNQCPKSIKQPGLEATVRLMEISDTRLGYLMRLFHNHSSDDQKIFVSYWLFADLEYLCKLYAGSKFQKVDQVFELFSNALGSRFLRKNVPDTFPDDIRQTKEALNGILDRLQVHSGVTRWFTMDNFSLRPLMQSDQLMELRQTIFPRLQVPLDRCYDEIVGQSFDVDALLQYHRFALRRLDAIVTEEFAYLVAAYGQLLWYEERLGRVNEDTTRDALIYSTDTMASYVHLMERLFVGRIDDLWSEAKVKAYRYSCQRKFDLGPSGFSPGATIAKKCKDFAFGMSDTKVSVYEWWARDAEKRIIGTLDPKHNTNTDKYMDVLFFIAESTGRISDKLDAICKALGFPHDITWFSIKDDDFIHLHTKITLTEDTKQNYQH